MSSSRFTVLGFTYWGRLAQKALTMPEPLGPRLAVCTTFARHHFVAIPADDIGHGNAPKCLANRTFVSFKLLLTCPHERGEF